ncbi:MAG: hypothetical protein EAZ27_04815 [Cytophagales bacterium]|nr:MAG: hypothetical protein EAZ27_04815 [Cytophagales bacterium]
MKKLNKKLILIAILHPLLYLQSCYINTTVVGKGGTTEFSRGKSYYLIGNRISEVDTKLYSDSLKNYTIDSRFNIEDYLLFFISAGIVSSRTVIVKK